ncbi:MAG: hydrogenase [Acidobacteria bacterium]|nr:MAG: hydrogenase [Acidobacteriota bacterium]
MNMKLEWLLVLLVLSNLRLLASGRLGAKIRTVAAQGILLGLVPLLGSSGHPGVHAIAIATAGIVIKGFFFPWLLLRAVRETRINREVQPYVGYLASVMIGLAGLAGAFLLSRQLTPLPGAATSLLVTAALFSLFTGLFLIVSRKRAINQVLGFLVLENGVFLFGAGAMGEMSLLVELGILLDILVAVFVMGITLFHINREFDHIETNRLADLKD